MTDESLWQWIATGTAGAVAGLSSWIAKSLHMRMSEVERDLYKHKLYAADTFAKNDTLSKGFDKMELMLKEIHTELKSKADK